eukprot:CAMPEP_0113891918 /NCGR_PEP_ID=MMETSP0780_2-20120614/15069_1 /TAXON_ID=652834 /ORGANISM="Palpitomonas bilix" /LENGTH=99 /DNA_ID=CAMNT_0000881681 /DNA_START=382 /DNA_END=681 /DNA_ORIENTATION=- /assembly_acc=CAM_ASM_000599
MQNLLRDVFGEASVYAVNFADVTVGSDGDGSDVAGSALASSSEEETTTFHIGPFEGKALTFSERAVTLAAAVTVDLDYFTRSSSRSVRRFMQILAFIYT